MDLLRALVYGISAQRPAHTLVIGGEYLPLEARMGGIFLGFTVGVLLLLVLGRVRACHLPAGWLAWLCGVAVLATGLDGLNASLADAGFPHLYEPNTAMRLFTGMVAGYGVALLALPVVAGMIWRAPVAVPAVLDVVELATGLAAAGLFGMLMLLDLPLLLWPVAVLMVVSVPLAFGAANLYLLAVATGRAQRASSPADLTGLLIAALGLALVEMAVLAALRLALSG